MSWTRETTIWCDGPECHKWTNGAGACRTVKQARRGAHREGWSTVNQPDGPVLDFCPRCRAPDR